MLAKVNFPREALLPSGFYQTLFRAGIKFAVLLAALYVMGIPLGSGLLSFPCPLLSPIIGGTALGLLFTAGGLLHTDFGNGPTLLLQFLMYLTPVVFAIPSYGWATALFHLNSLTPLIVLRRDLIIRTVTKFVITPAS